ncbi:MAG: mechanosensitive ion channel family protein [Gammaproteobacteria bacterium]
MTNKLIQLFNHPMHWLTKFPMQYFWIVEFCIVVLITFFISILQNIIHSCILPRLEKTDRVWDDSLIYSIHAPLKFLIWLLGITYAADIVREATHAFAIFELISPIRRIGIVVFLVWFLVLYIKRIAERLVHPDYAIKVSDKTTVDAVGKLLILLIIVAAFLVVLQEVGVPVSGVIAFGGGGAIIIGWAAKDSLSNLAGGLMIYFDRPFAVGDWIRSPDKKIEGTVEYIGWRRTRIRTFDKRPLYVPNGIFSNLVIENPSRMTNRRIRTNFGVRYCDAPKLPAIIKDIEKMLKNHPDIDTQQMHFAKLVKFDESSLNILLYAFTKTTQWVPFQTVQEEVFFKIIDIIYNKHQASMAFPTRTLEVPQGLAINLMQNTGITHE